MRMSCNGCRVLRKGCSENCSIRPCLDWIKNPDAQANATVFLAKFYGRAGLMNLINAGPQHLRPAIFRSLLYEACGRILNPIFGSVGLLWSGSWQLCQNAVEAVLNGSPITRIESETAAQCPPLKAYDIRHVSKGEETESTKTESNGLKRVRTRGRFKRSKVRLNRPVLHHLVDDHLHKAEVLGRRELEEGEVSPSHESSLSHQSEPRNPSSSVGDLDQGLDYPNRTEDGEVELELTLGFEPLKRCSQPVCGGK